MSALRSMLDAITRAVESAAASVAGVTSLVTGAPVSRCRCSEDDARGCFGGARIVDGVCQCACHTEVRS